MINLELGESAMKRILWFLIVVVATVYATSAGAAGLLWKVSDNGLEKPSYIFGSFHLAPKSFIDSVAGLREAIASVDVIYGEIEADSLTSLSTQNKMACMAIAPDDSTLSKVCTAEQLAKIENIYALYTGAEMVKMLEICKPSVISMQLQLMQTAKICNELGIAPETSFDVAVMSIEPKKPVKGLETIDMQIDMLMGEPISVQVKELMNFVDNFAAAEDNTVNLIRAYLAQDLDTVTDLVTNDSDDIDRDLIERLIFQRNRSWAEKLSVLMHNHSLFLVVGAGHLGGEKGLINLLRDRGYTLTAVQCKNL